MLNAPRWYRHGRRMTVSTVEKQIAAVFEKLDLTMEHHLNRRVLAVLA